MKMKQKISFGMLGIMVLFIVAGVMALLSVQKNQQRLEDFIDKDIVILQSSNNLYAQGLQMEQALRNIVLAPSVRAAYGNHEEASREFDDVLKAALTMANGNPARQKALQEIAELRKQQASLHGKIIGQAASNQGAAIQMINAEGTPLWRNLKGRLLESIKTNTDAFKSARNEAVASTNARFAVTLALMAAAVILGIIVSVWIVRSVTRPLSQALEIAQTIASGNLNTQIEVSRKDEFGELLQAMALMNNALQNMIWHVRQGVDTFTTATREIASGNQDLSSRTEEQASSLEETASSMEELTSTVRQNADNARQANQLAAAASDVATKGGSVVSEVVDTMRAIDASSKKIADIINVIDGIAFQTNILALNAAVEAARAGEQGRGFAVVATEVRSLAQRSAAAAREIKTLIEDSVGKVEIGNRLVGQAGNTMQEVVTSIRRVTDIMGEISEASREQSDGIDQVNQAITQMDSVTQQNAALVEEAAAAAEALQNQANELANVISVFKVKSAKYGSMEEAFDMVQKAVSYLKENGREKGFAEICNRLGRFNDRDLYVVVYDLNGRNLAHGAFAAMVGKDLIDAKDGGGKFYVRERLAIVKANGKGWQDYTFTNPVTKQMEPKSMYLEQLDDYIVGCGAYKR